MPIEERIARLVIFGENNPDMQGEVDLIIIELKKEEGYVEEEQG